jgi:pimeloyl-ACP methyl ester carboxylesterase
MWDKEFTPEIKKDILEKGEWLRASEYDPVPYPITRVLIEDGRNNLVMDKKLEFKFPVRIVQGMLDPDVPWQYAKKLAETIKGDCKLELVGDGDHRLSTQADIALLEITLGSLLA